MCLCLCLCVGGGEGGGGQGADTGRRLNTEKLSLVKKALPSFLPMLEPGTFQSRVMHPSTETLIPLPMPDNRISCEPPAVLANHDPNSLQTKCLRQTLLSL